MILTMIAQEKKRIEYMLTRYQEEYDRLPKGSLSEKKAGTRTYYYLKYRDGKKVVSEYINKSRIDEVRIQLEKRRHIEVMMKSLQEELAIANRVLEEEL
mgnify:FL=1